MIIIEGPDGAGKTRLAKQLQELTGLKIHHWGTPPKTAEELANNLMKSRQLTREPIIQERSPWVTEPIYDVALNGENRTKTWPHYYTALLLLKTPVVYCRPPQATIIDYSSLPSGPGDTLEYLKWVSENIINITRLYDLFMEITKPAITYDWTKPDAHRKRGEMVKLIKRQKLLMDIRSNLPKGVKLRDELTLELRQRSTPKREPVR